MDGTFPPSGLFMLVAEAMSASTTSLSEFQRPGDLFRAATIRPEAPAVYAKGNRFFNNILLNCAAYNTPNGGVWPGMFEHRRTGQYADLQQQDAAEPAPNGYNGYLIKYHNDGYLKT